MTDTGQQLERSPVRERGMALLVVLWLIVAAALIVSAFGATVRSGVSFASSEVKFSKTEALLDAGAEIAASRLIDEDAARRWATDGRAYAITFAGATLTIAIRDASARIDVNKADKKLLLGLLRQFSKSEAKAGRLRDRILLVRGDASDNPEEQQTGKDAGASRKDAAGFFDVAQLRDIEGLTPEIYDAIAPFLTVYSGDGRINPQAASEEVLASIPGISQSDIKRLQDWSSRPPSDDPDLKSLTQRFGKYAKRTAGPAYTVTVKVAVSGNQNGFSAVYVLLPGIDADAPYRLIARRPTAIEQPSGIQ
jgi:general secretion pathway protein K